MSLRPLDTKVERDGSFLSPVAYDDDAISLHSRSERDTDSEDDEILAAARNSRELRARDRLVLMEEEETHKLVADTRAQRDRRRRGSNLALPNPINMIRSYAQARSPSPMDRYGSSVEDLRDEKRSSRRNRRKAKKDRLLKEARDGEDGQLMYEMESGGIKDGSSTGESSDREDSDELDRRRLNQISDAKSSRRRKWRKWIFIHSAIAVGVTFLVLLAWRLSLNKEGQTNPLMSNGTALFAPTTLIISLDGFRADFLTRDLTPRLNAFIKEGVSPLYMTPSFPSVTFPNHYTIATGLYPESHGVVGNTFWDPELNAEFYYTDPDRSMDPKWWGGEPFWVTAELQGVRTAIHMWPGSEAGIMGMNPSFLDRYNGKENLPNKVKRILELLDKPGLENPDADIDDTRPQIIAAYVPNVDGDGHRYGPNSTEIRLTISAVDAMLDEIFAGLEERNLTNIVNVIVVSDHGMATTDVSRMIQVEDIVDMAKIDHLDGWPLVGIRPKQPEFLQELYEQATEKLKSNPNFEVYLTAKDMPERYHFNQSDRIAPLWVIPKTGWAIVEKAEFDIMEAKAMNQVYHPRGLHGYDHEHPLMRAIFVARGPAFPHQPHSKVETFQNINVYNILCDSIGMEPKPNNGTLRLPLKIVGPHDPETVLEQPEDPMPTAVEESATGMMSILPVETGTVQDGSEDPASSAADEESAMGMMSILPVQTGSNEEEPETPPAADAVDAPPDEPSTPLDEDETKGSSSWWDKVQDALDWAKNKVDDLLSKITGSDDSS